MSQTKSILKRLWICIIYRHFSTKLPKRDTHVVPGITYNAVLRQYEKNCIAIISIIASIASLRMHVCLCSDWNWSGVYACSKGIQILYFHSVIVTYGSVGGKTYSATTYYTENIPIKTSTFNYQISVIFYTWSSKGDPPDLHLNQVWYGSFDAPTNYVDTYPKYFFWKILSRYGVSDSRGIEYWQMESSNINYWYRGTTAYIGFFPK